MTRILLDEGVARTLARCLRDLSIDASAFPNEWKQLPDGDLLDRMGETGHDLLITADRNMVFQQDLSGRPVAVLVVDQVGRPQIGAQALAIAGRLDQIAVGGFWRLTSGGDILPLSDRSRL